MSYLHLASEVIELKDRNYVSIRSQSWETNTITGKDTIYTLEVKLTAPKEYSNELYNHLKGKGYNVIAINPHTLEVTLKTKQANKREELTDNLSNTVNLFFENERLL